MRRLLRCHLLISLAAALSLIPLAARADFSKLMKAEEQSVRQFLAKADDQTGKEPAQVKVLHYQDIGPGLFRTAKKQVITSFLWWGDPMKEQGTVDYLVHAITSNPTFRLKVILPNLENEESLALVKETLPQNFTPRQPITPTPYGKILGTLEFLRDKILSKLNEKQKDQVIVELASWLSISAYVIDDQALVSFYQNPGLKLNEIPVYQLPASSMQSWLLTQKLRAKKRILGSQLNQYLKR